MILEIDWQGAQQVRASAPETRTIFILPPSREALKQRLKARGQDSDVTIARRMEAAISELSHYHEFDYLIVNADFDIAVEALRSIVIANRQLREVQLLRQQELLRALLS